MKSVRPVTAPFTSAYAAAAGAEPPFTNFRRCRDDKTLEETPLFAGCLDYILARSPPLPGPQLVLQAVSALPSEAELRAAPGGALPTAGHPSDHVPIAATYALRV